jgi:hypothetical protein
MWCNACRQDVPGLSTQNRGEYKCPRCAGIVCARMEGVLPVLLASIPADTRPSSAAPRTKATGHDLSDLTPLDTWELDEQLRHTARLLEYSPAADAEAADTRFDLAQSAAAGWHRPRGRGSTMRGRHHSRSLQGAMGLLGAVASWLGIAALTCGGILLGWAEMAARQELQLAGLPIAAGGVVVLALGLALHPGENASDQHSPARSATRRIDVKEPGHASAPRGPKASPRNLRKRRRCESAA